jgi:putative oxidoreductase
LPIVAENTCQALTAEVILPPSASHILEAQMIPERNAPQVYALMRIVFGLVFVMYGSQKFGMLGGIDGRGGAAPFLSWPFGIAGAIEVILGTLIAIGLVTKLAAFIASGEMAVAYFMVHQLGMIQIGQGSGPTPVQNGGQAAVLFCFGFLYIAAHGAGIWSVDGARGGSPSRRGVGV